MKKALIISSIIFVVSIIAFGVSVAATGLRESNFSLQIGLQKIFDADTLRAGEEKKYDFTENIENLEIESTISDTKIILSDTETVKVNYKTTKGGHSFNAYVDGNILKVEEKSAFLSFITWDFGDSESTLEIELPEKEYNDVNLISVSGDIKIENLICDEFTSVTTSGNTDYKIFANTIDIYTTSGSVNASNCTDRKAAKLVIGSTSGNHSVSGFATDKYEIYTTSGLIRADKLSGEGTVVITSGEVYLDFAQWNGDIDVEAVSGEVDITLPEDSGVTVDVDAVSGGVEVVLGSEGGAKTMTANLSGESNSGIVGGSNVHNVNVDLVSGEVNIHN